MQKMWGHVNEPFPKLEASLPDDSAALAAVVARATAKDPGERYPSAGDLARAAGVARGRRSRVEDRAERRNGRGRDRLGPDGHRQARTRGAAGRRRP